MRSLISALMFLALATPALADNAPEPGSLSLVAVAVAAAFWVGRKKK